MEGRKWAKEGGDGRQVRETGGWGREKDKG